MNEERASRWEDRYRQDVLPWDTGRPDHHLMDLVLTHALAPCRVLEIGCGTGTNAVWLAQSGFTVTGLDVAPSAIERARERAAAAGAQVTFLVHDLLAGDIPGGPFDLVYDRGVLHSFHEHDDRVRVAERLAARLSPGGLWLSLLGSTDGPPREMGPPRRSARDIAAAVEEPFEILSLRATHFDTRRSDAPRAWLCLMRKRPYPPQPSTREADLSR